MEMNDTGIMVEEEWLFTGDKNGALKLDAYCIMPNHFHAILWLVSDSGLRDKGLLQLEENADPNRDYGVALVGEIIEKFKATVTDRSNTVRNTPGIPFWQPGYHGHVLRSSKILPAMRRYVNENPVNWSRDLLNPLVGDPSCLVPAAWTSSK